MPIYSRPTDSVTVDYLQLGMPFVEFAALQTNGSYSSYRSFGVIDSFEISRELNIPYVPNRHSGVERKLREIVQMLSSTINIATYQHSAENLQLILGCGTLTTVTGGTETSTDEQFYVTDDGEDYRDLQHQLMDESTTVLSPAPIVDEDVGVGQGSPFGETKGDFSLDWKPLVTGDVSAFTVGGTDRLSDLVTGAPTGSGEIGLFVGTGADSGQLQFYTGEGPAAGAAIVASYEPTHTLTRNTHYSVDPKHGRVRVFDVGGATDPIQDFQPMEITYDYTEITHSELVYATQPVFEGKARIRLLTDQLINLVWEIPKVSIRITDDSYVFNGTDPAIANLAMTLLDNETSTPFGTIKLYAESSYA